MKKAVYLFAMLLFAALHFSCQKGEQWNKTRVKGIVVDADDNPIANVLIQVFEKSFSSSSTMVLEIHTARSDANGEYKIEAFRAERSNDTELELYASQGPTGNKGYQSMNWWPLDVAGDRVVLHKGRDYKIKITFR